MDGGAGWIELLFIRVDRSRGVHSGARPIAEVVLGSAFNREALQLMKNQNHQHSDIEKIYRLERAQCSAKLVDDEDNGSSLPTAFRV